MLEADRSRSGGIRERQVAGRASCTKPTEDVTGRIAGGQVKLSWRPSWLLRPMKLAVAEKGVCSRVLELRRGERRRERKGHEGLHVGSQQCRGTSCVCVCHENEKERMRRKLKNA